MASLERRKGKRAWRVNYRRGGRGSPLLHSEWTGDKSEAERWKAKIERELAAASMPDEEARGRVVAWEVLCEKWKEYKASKGRSARYTDEGHTRLLAIGKAQKWKTLRDVKDTEDLSTYDWRLVRTLAQWAVERLEQSAPRMRRPDKPRQKRPRHDLLEPGVIASLIAEASAWMPANGAIAHLVAIYGHRPQSLVGLTVNDLRLDGPRPTMRGRFKGHGVDTYPILPQTVDILRPLVAGKTLGDPVFISHLGEPWKTGQEYSAWFHHYVGKGIGIYQLKCYAITSWLDAGIDAPTVASITKHSTMSELLKYLRTNSARQDKALAIKSTSPVFGVPRVPTNDEQEVLSPDSYRSAGSSIG